MYVGTRHTTQTHYIIISVRGEYYYYCHYEMPVPVVEPNRLESGGLSYTPLYASATPIES